MKKYLLWLICVTSLLLSACTSKPTTSAWLTKGVEINLPDAKLGQSYNDKQLLTFSYAGKKNSLMTLVNSTSYGINVIGLSTLGIRLFKIEYHDKIIETEQNIFIKNLPPASQILSDIMLSIYPIQKWQAVLPQGWILVDQGKSRKLFDDKKNLIIEITYQQKASKQIRKPIYIKHYIFGYQIAIQSVE